MLWLKARIYWLLYRTFNVAAQACYIACDRAWARRELRAAAHRIGECMRREQDAS